MLCKHSLPLFHWCPFFRSVIATPFLILFHALQGHESHGQQHSLPSLPCPAVVTPCFRVRTCMLLKQPFFWIQITETKSSAGSILTQSANVFICSSDLPGHQQSYQTHEKILVSLYSWPNMCKHKPKGCFGGRAETGG